VVTIKNFHSTEVFQKFFFLTVFRSSTLVRALAFPQWFWERPFLCCCQIWTSWGKKELDHRRRL